ncbi:MAG: GuaB3 family IMP dehydrogenase-related protein [Elusimicrobiota bacterium]
MPFFIGHDREVRRCYGFDEIALVPSGAGVEPDSVDTSLKIGDILLDIPVLASAVDGVVDTRFAIEMGKLGGLGVLNLDGINTRYEKPREVVARIAAAGPRDAARLVREIYREPTKERLIARRVSEIVKTNVPCAVSTTPENADEYGPIAQEAGCDIFVVQSMTAAARHPSTRHKPFDIASFCERMEVPVVVGNSVGFDVAVELMEAGISGLLVGVGPNASSPARRVLGLGVPQATATIDSAAARDFYFKKTGRYVPVIADGGIGKGGDLCKAIACGADGAMIGSPLARAEEAPGQGYHWGATTREGLPLGARVHVGVTGTLKEVLFGPRLDDGSQNLVGALKTCMGAVGASTIKEMQLTEIIIALATRAEGGMSSGPT